MHCFYVHFFLFFIDEKRKKPNQRKRNTLFPTGGELRLTPSLGQFPFDELAHQTDLSKAF